MKDSTIDMVGGISTITRNTRDSGSSTVKVKSSGSKKEMTRREKTHQSKPTVCIEVGSLADGMWVVVEKPGPGS